MDYFQGSVAQEDVKFVTEIVTESVIGENFSKLMVFIEATKYVRMQLLFKKLLLAYLWQRLQKTTMLL